MAGDGDDGFSCLKKVFEDRRESKAAFGGVESWSLLETMLESDIGSAVRVVAICLGLAGASLFFAMVPTSCDGFLVCDGCTGGGGPLLYP